MSTIETWKDVPEYIGKYQASNFGRIKSLKRKVFNGKGFRNINERILIFKTNLSGYLVCNLYNNAVKKDFFVHVLIAKTFIENKGDQVDHIDNNKLNNALINLMYISARDNCRKRSLIAPKTSKYSNVHWHKASRKWAATIRIDGGRKHLGYFKNEDDANSAVIDALDIIHENTDEIATVSTKKRFSKI